MGEAVSRDELRKLLPVRVAAATFVVARCGSKKSRRQEPAEVRAQVRPRGQTKRLARIREATTEKRATRKAIRDLIKLRSANYAAGSAARMRMRNGVDADADDLYVISRRTI